MRIVGGKFAGTDLVSPNDFRVHPTAEPVRAAMLDRLRDFLHGARVLDLFAGTGALGLEALSRGAATADFVETRPASLHALKANVVRLRMRERTRVFKKDALPFAAGLDPNSYDIAFVDPPYESRMLDRVIETWQRTSFAPILVAEHAAAHVLPPAAERKQYGDTSVSFYGVLRRARLREE
jgi:16S rRNA (guanine966-N2)-methyltransferase